MTFSFKLPIQYALAIVLKKSKCDYTIQKGMKLKWKIAKEDSLNSKLALTLKIKQVKSKVCHYHFWSSDDDQCKSEKEDQLGVHSISECKVRRILKLFFRFRVSSSK